jgi:glycosyltransferase involved in cell wall biosynthesis
MIALAAALPAGEFEQTIVVLEGRGSLKSVAARVGFEVVCVDQRWSLDPTALARLSGELRKRVPHVVHTWDDSSRQYVTCVAGGGEWRMISEWSPKERRGIRLFGSKSRCGRPDRWVVASAADKLAASRRIELDTISVIAPGVPVDAASRLSRDELWTKLNLPEGARLVGTACSLTATSGVKELIWAADMVRVLHPKLRYLIAGDGPQRANLERFGRTAAVPENIVFLGDIADWADILPHLEVYWQGTEPGKLSTTEPLQAMAVGVPVVASNTPQHAEWIADGANGYLVPFDGRSERTRVTDQFFTDTAHHETMSLAAKQTIAERFSLAARVEAFAKLYQELAS